MTAQHRAGFWWYLTLLSLAALMWSGQGTAVKFLEAHMGPIAITFVPFYITTVLFVPLLIYKRRKNPAAEKPTPGDWGKFVLAGIGGQVLAQLGMTWGILKSLASNGAILNLFIPIMSAVLASIMLKERLTLLRIACFVIGLAGVALLSIQDFRQSSFGEMKYLEGNALILAGCLGSSFYNVYCKGLLKRFQEIEILIFSYITATLATLPLLVWVEPFHLSAFASFGWTSWLAFAFLVLFMYGASMLLFFHALEHLDVTVASMALYMVPVFGVILAAVMVGERLGTAALAGAGVVLVSTVLIMKYDSSAG
ncbi:MAG: DMT family transporter [Acidobacteriales bacterium]|nr:DMT family transporter [Terriglobales bacterium]